MMKYVAPIEQRLRHLPRPAMFHEHHATQGDMTTGQKVAEIAAARVGSWPFLIIQSVFLALWVIFNIVAAVKFDPPPFILLNLMLSFQAAFTGPVLLIAANAGAARDHAQYDRMEAMEQRIIAALDELKAMQAPKE